MQHLSALRRHWFPLCRSTDLGRKPLGRALLGEPMVLFRDEAGRPAALADRCPHRNAPLSAGWLSAGRVVCPYHGWQFDGAGECRAVPGLCGEAGHPARRVAAYPVAEGGGLVWASLDPAGPPPAPAPLVAGEVSAVREFRLEAGLVDALENFLDATHTHFVHAGVVRGERPRRRVTAVVRGGGDRVEAEYLGEGQQSGLVSRIFGGGVDSSLGRFILPSTVELEYRAGGGPRLVIALHYTPEGGDSLRVFAVARGRTAPLPPWAVVGPMGLLLGLVVRQDRRILDMQRLNLARFGGERYSSTELDVMRPHILRLLRAAEAGVPAEPFERRVELLL